jgi:hypothetical protein
MLCPLDALPGVLVLSTAPLHDVSQPTTFTVPVGLGTRDTDTTAIGSSNHLVVLSLSAQE